MTLQLLGSAAGQYATADATGAVSLAGGSLNVNVQNFSLAAGDLFTLMNFAAGDLSGIFAGFYVNGYPYYSGVSANIGNGLTAGLVYNDQAGNVELEVVATPATTTETWTAGNGAWSTTADWSNGAPNFTSDVMIGASAAAVTLAQDATIDSLTLDAGILLTTASATDLSIGAGITTAATSALSIGGEAFADGGAVNDGSIAAVGTIVDIRGAVTGSGSFTIDKNATLEFGGADAETVNFNGAGATLKLDAPASFSGVLANIAVGDAIDLAGVVVTSPLVTGGTTLTFTDANNNAYSYSLTGFPGGSSFVAQSDGAGGTLLIVTPPPTTVTLNPIDGKNVINHAEAAAGRDPRPPSPD